MVVMILTVAVAGVVLSPTNSVDQPIPFNHRVHVQDLGLDCTDCHIYAKTGVRATIPNVEICSACHVETLSGSPGEAQLLDHVRSEQAIPWRKVYWVPEHVYFSHRQHTSLAGIDCEVCHGPVGEREEALTNRLVEVTMDDCIQCHDEQGTSDDCIACHR